jgi:hypothetical protein
MLITMKRFWRELDKVKSLGWELKEGGKVRAKDWYQNCPYLAIPTDMHLSEKEASNIWNAADNKPRHNKRIRQALLRHLGLKENQ